MEKVSIIVLVAPSFGGKGHIENKVKEEYSEEVDISISATTRPMRYKNGIPIEKEGEDYYFLDSINSFSETEMLESEVFVHSDGQITGYGTPLLGIEDAFSSGKHIIASLEPKGAKKIKENFPNCVLCYISTSKERIMEMLNKVMADSTKEDYDDCVKRVNRADIKSESKKIGIDTLADIELTDYLSQEEMSGFLSDLVLLANKVGLPSKEALEQVRKYASQTPSVPLLEMSKDEKPSKKSTKVKLRK